MRSEKINIEIKATADKIIVVLQKSLQDIAYLTYLPNIRYSQVLDIQEGFDKDW